MRAAMVLAAGGSRRFGRGDKLLVRIGGRAILDHALDRALAAPAVRVLAVVPSLGGRVARLVRRRREGRLVLVVARAHRRGMGASFLAGLARVRPIERELLVFLGDMPAARAVRGMRLPPGCDAARPMIGGRPGHPMLVRTAAARAACVRADDRGLAGRLDPCRVALIRGVAANELDVDTRAAIGRARHMHRGRGRCWT